MDLLTEQIILVVFDWHYNNTFNGFTYNDFTYTDSTYNYITYSWFYLYVITYNSK